MRCSWAIWLLFAVFSSASPCVVTVVMANVCAFDFLIDLPSNIETRKKVTSKVFFYKYSYNPFE
jgi:hypothetical protein